MTLDKTLNDICINADIIKSGFGFVKETPYISNDFNILMFPSEYVNAVTEKLTSEGYEYTLLCDSSVGGPFLNTAKVEIKTSFYPNQFKFKAGQLLGCTGLDKLVARLLLTRKGEFGLEEKPIDIYHVFDILKKIQMHQEIGKIEIETEEIYSSVTIKISPQFYNNDIHWLLYKPRNSSFFEVYHGNILGYKKKFIRVVSYANKEKIEIFNAN